MWVAQLLDLDTHDWDRGKLEQCFPPQIADKIEGIPLPRGYEADSWVWYPDRSGQYSVRSGYHHARSSLASTSTAPSIPSSQRYWKVLWGLSLPSKIRVFFWQLCRDILPVRIRLQDKFVQCTAICSLCSNGSETLLHLFRDCSFTREAQVFTSQFCQSSISHCVSFWDMYCTLVEMYSADYLCFFVWFCWVVWDIRNDIVWNSGQHNPAEVGFRVAYLKREYERAMDIYGTEKCRTATNRGEDVGWIPPPSGQYVINIDGAIFSNIDRVGIGIIIRDSAGNMIAARSIKKRTYLDPFLTEALALKYALEWTRDIGLTAFSIQSDCLQLVQAFAAGSRAQCTEVGFVIDRCKNLLHTNPTTIITHVRRQNNRAAHNLAQQARYVDSEMIWWNEVPSGIADIVDAERSVYGRTL